MSTRTERMSDKAQNERNAKLLKELMARADNRRCADCRKKDPRWASWNLGVFVCIRCSGHHRSLGTHISKVKSADLDSWTEEQVLNMAKWGNARANQYWEHDLPSNFTPPDSNIDHFIRSKYERKQYAMKGPVPDPETLKLPDGVATTPASAATQPKPIAVSAAPAAQAQFANFAAAPAASTPAPSAAQQLFDAFQSPPSQQQQQAQQQPSQGDLKNSILSLYGNAGSSAPSNPINNSAVPGFGNFGAFPPQPQPGGFGALTSPQTASNTFAGFPPSNTGLMSPAFASGFTNAPVQHQSPPQNQPLGAQFFGASPVQKQPSTMGGIPDFAGFSSAATGQGAQNQGQANPLGHTASDDWGAFQ
ncbi:hypothetical protein SpCBS45565_g01750 [Spizellomyces sp. 'palustris']|nr:hypothetical protein SpCBS45565_g01750 [Spizellomyces sp. 'palustris']